MNTVIVAREPLNIESWTRHDVEDVSAFLVQHFDGKWPDTARIYHQQVATDHDVTPHDKASVERLQQLTGTFYVVVYPGWMVVVAIVVAVAAVAMAFALRPQVPNPSIRGNQHTPSPNNALSDRQNEVRINGRIPDIFGTVRSTPDLLAVPYKFFVDNKEMEVAYLCIGRGEYDVSDIRDGATPATDIDGMQVEVYKPFTSPRSGDAPQLRIGSPIGDKLVSSKRFSSVNGQTLYSPNYKKIDGAGGKVAVYGFHTIKNNGSFDFTKYYGVGDHITLSNAHVVGDARDYLGAWHHVDGHFDGEYIVHEVSPTEMNVEAPEGSWPDSPDHGDWPMIWHLTDTIWTDIVIATGTVGGWIGPFTLDVKDLNQVLLNIVAMNGLFKLDNSGNQTSMNVQYTIEATPVDAAGNPRGPTVTMTDTIEGSASVQNMRAKTSILVCDANPTPFTGKCTVRVRRDTLTDYGWAGTINDEIQWRDVYALSPVAQAEFGNVTTVQAVTRATSSALAVEERKLNMLVTRKIPARAVNGGFTPVNYPSNSIADILSAVCLDPYIGNRTIDELDVQNFYDTIAAVVAYFGSSKTGEFNYTFDQTNLSFEETVAAIAQVGFCTAYRRGSVIRLSFERETSDSLLLFNHRNKVPRTEVRTVTFGRLEDNDGVEYQYVDPEDDAVVTLYLPGDQTALNPKKVESIGVRSKLQAYFQANRIWNRMQYQNTAVEFEATQEADILVVQDRFLCADNTRPDVQDGEVLRQNGLELELSQPVTFQPGESYTIFLQHVDGTVEALVASPGSNSRHVVLGQAPKLALSVDPSNFARAGYILVANGNEPSARAFLVTEKEAKSNFTVTLRGVNYDARYYANDKDLVHGVVDAGGNIIPIPL